MRTIGRGGYACASHVSFHDLRDTRSRKPSKWCYAAKENVLILNARPVLEVGEYGVANFLRQWKALFATILAGDKKAAIIPVNVSKTKLRHIAGAET